MKKKVTAIYTWEDRMRRDRELTENLHRANMRGHIERVIKRVEAAKARERQARLERVAPLSEYRKKK